MPSIEDQRKQLLDSCSEIAYCDSIPLQLERLIRLMGFAGSADLPKLVYLTMFTSLLKRPVSLLIKGPSGAGKSFSLGMGKQFIPTSAYEAFEGMSEKAIVYLKGLSLKHKHLIIGEASGMAEGSGRTLLRQLLSEGKVRYATVESTDKGLKGSELPILEGPCGLIMTTTATGIHPEDENRMLAVNMRESAEQIGQALLAFAEGATREPYPLDLDPWFALHEYVNLGPKRVFIPYAREIALAMPRTHDKVKRDFPQVLSLISASALMHTCTRETTRDGHVVANQDDYQLVYDLVNEPISEGLAKAVPDTIRSIVDAVASTTGRESFQGLSNTQLAELLGRDPSVISRTTTKAIEEGYLENTNPGQGREAKLIVGGRRLPNGSALPTPSALFPTTERPMEVAW